MKETIEVPRDLIEAGDWDAIKKLLPQPKSIFGRMATHQKVVRVMCVSHATWGDGLVNVALHDDACVDGTHRGVVHLTDLDFDPLTLTTVDDFENAPEGTIVAHEDHVPIEKTGDEGWVGDVYYEAYEAAERGPWSVVRWGRGEQA